MRVRKSKQTRIIGGDGGIRTHEPLARLPDFECGLFNHLGTSPYISVCFILKKFLERKAGENTENYSIFDFENPFISRIPGGRNDQVAVKFRVL